MRLYYDAIQTIMNGVYNPLVKLNPFDKPAIKQRCQLHLHYFPRIFQHLRENMRSDSSMFSDGLQCPKVAILQRLSNLYY